MALDPSIPLSVRQQSFNPLGVMSAVTQMRQQERLEAEAAAEREERKQAQVAAKQEVALKAVARAMLPIKGLPPDQRAPKFTATVRSLKQQGFIPPDFDEAYTPGDDDQWLDSMPSVLMTDAQRVEPYLPPKPAPPQGLMELPDGTVFDPNTRTDVRKGTPPPPPQRNPTEASLAQDAASSDPAVAGPAVEALRMLRLQRPAPASADRNPTEASLALDAASPDPAVSGAARTALAIMRRQRPVGGGDTGPLESIVGPDGKAILMTREQAIGKTRAAGTERGSSGVQKRVLNFFTRAQQADAELESAEGQIQQLGLTAQGWMKFAPNFAQTQLGQSYLAAQRAFTEARLRKDSGAAIPPHEFASDRQTYFAQPGDSATTLEQKRRARAAMLAALAFESGQALAEFVGDADEARAVVESYKARAAKPGAKVASEGWTELSPGVRVRVKP